jgi:hypothetical protein
MTAASSPPVGNDCSPELPRELEQLLRTNTGWSKRVLCLAGLLGLVVVFSFASDRFVALSTTRLVSVPNRVTRTAATARSTTVDASRHHVRSRTLQADDNIATTTPSSAAVEQDIPYRIRLVLALEYLNDDAAFAIESSRTIPSTGAALHFCRAVNEQVRHSVDRVYSPLVSEWYILTLAISATCFLSTHP